jgi:hypothetical protein
MSLDEIMKWCCGGSGATKWGRESMLRTLAANKKLGTIASHSDNPGASTVNPWDGNKPTTIALLCYRRTLASGGEDITEEDLRGMDEEQRLSVLEQMAADLIKLHETIASSGVDPKKLLDREYIKSGKWREILKTGDIRLTIYKDLTSLLKDLERHYKDWDSMTWWDRWGAGAGVVQSGIATRERDLRTLVQEGPAELNRQMKARETALRQAMMTHVQLLGMSLGASTMASEIAEGYSNLLTALRRWVERAGRTGRFGSGASGRTVGQTAARGEGSTGSRSTTTPEAQAAQKSLREEGFRSAMGEKAATQAGNKVDTTSGKPDTSVVTAPGQVEGGSGAHVTRLNGLNTGVVIGGGRSGTGSTTTGGAPEAPTMPRPSVPESSTSKTPVPADKSIDLAKDLTRGHKDKTVATDGGQYVSGWKKPPKGYDKVSPETVASHCKEIGHDLKRSGANDQVENGGFEGKYNASHAEKQSSVGSPNEPVSVSRPMCADCQRYFQKEAIFRGQDQIVSDPQFTRTFHPDGTVTRIPR